MVNQHHKTQLILSLLFGFALLFCLPTHAQEFSAKVNRTHISMGDQFYLTLRYNGKMDFDSPDLSALKNDFYILHTSRQARSNIILGGGANKRETYTQWQVLLSPKKVGKLRISPIEFQGKRTQPIDIDVRAVKSNIANTTKDKFFEISLDKSTAYVQEQIIYRERFYILNDFRDAQITPLDVPNANVIELNKPEITQTQLNGQTYNLVERIFAIFPQKAGELVIPAQQFSGKIINRANAFFGTPFSATSKARRIQIKAIPQSYPNAPWIVAKQLDLSESFSQADNSWKVGDAVTRNIKLTAAGVNASQLAALPMQEIKGLKYYPDELKPENQTTPNGIQGSLFQSMALVATKSANITLPAIKVPFWNSQTDQLDYASLPARKIQIKPIAQPNKQNSSTAKISPQATTQPSIESTSNSKDQNNGVWTLVFLLLLFSNAAFALLWWREKNQKVHEQDKHQEQNEQSYKQSLKHLKAACMNNNPEEIRQALMQWGKLYLADSHPNSQMLSLIDISQAVEQPTLSLAIAELNALLYGKDENSAFNGQLIWQAVKSLKKQESKQARDTLPSLEIS